MNRDVKAGLALVCLGGLLGVVWFALSRSDDPSLDDGAALLGALAALAAVAGFGVVIKGLIAD